MDAAGGGEQSRTNRRSDPIEALVGLGEPRYTAREVAERSGMPLEDARRLWRAMGFVRPPEDARIFTDEDVQVVASLVEFINEDYADLELVLAMTRVCSQSLARVADAQAAAVRDQVTTDPAKAARLVDDEGGTPKIFASLEKFMIHVWRRHLSFALERANPLEPPEEGQDKAVGFADLVDFTRLSRELEAADLASLVEEMESTSQEIVSSVGGRIVKMIGDEVMFVADDARSGAEIALRLVGSAPEGNGRPQMRVGLAFGPVVAHRGDFIGPTVNLASRVAGTARPNSVLISEGMKDALSDEDDYEVKPIRRRRLKGFGPTRLWVLRRAEGARSLSA